MSRGVNKVILLGNLGNDPEVRYTQSGMAITTISLATTSVRKDRDGNTQEYTEWHRVKFFGKLAEIAGEYLTKGKQVYVEGSIRYSTVDGDDGQKKYFTDIVADQMQMLGGGSEREREDRTPQRDTNRSPGPSRGNSREPARGSYGGSPPRGNPPPTQRVDEPFPDDDIPF